MSYYLPFITLLLLVASASASIFKGGNVEPNNNPIVDKYHTDTDIAAFTERLVFYILIGVLGSLILLTITLIYYTFRFCRTWLCCCIKACRVNKTRARSDSFEKEMLNANPVVSWVLRISIFLLFLLTMVLIAIGLAASNEVHTNIVETTATINNHFVYMNATAYHANYTLSHLINFNISKETTENMIQLTNSTNEAAETSNQLNTVGPHIDSIRRNTTVSVYVFAFVPLLIGIVGAVLGRGRLTYIMSMILPWFIIGFWLLFAFHYSMFIINVDVCYAVDQFMIDNITNNDGTTTNALSAFNCSSYSSSVDPTLNLVYLLTNETEAQLNQTTDPNERQELEYELINLQNLTSTFKELQDCGTLTKIITVAYPDLCGKAIEASLFLWRSQIGLAVVLLITTIVGIIAENKIVRGGNKKKKDDYSTLALLN